VESEILTKDGQRQMPGKNPENKCIVGLEEAPIKVKGEKLDEIKLSWAGKLFFAGAAAYITGKGLQQKVKLPIKVRGTPQQMRAVVDAIVSSKEFQREVGKPGATIDSVVNKLRLRNLTKQRFQQLTGVPWPL